MVHFAFRSAKFQAGISLSKYLPKEILIHNVRLIPIWKKYAEFKLSADSKHFKSYFGYETQKRVAPYAVDYSDIRFPCSIFIKLDKMVFQRIRNNISSEFRVIFKVFREENCQPIKDMFQAL